MDHLPLSRPAGLSLVIGGARSGKSTLGERLAEAVGSRVLYVATAEAGDAEMAERIERHRSGRAGRGWVTIEAPRDLASVLKRPEADVVLIDCLTLWLSNHLLAGSDVAAETEGLVRALDGCDVPVIAVSNEVGWSIVPDNALARKFRDEQGRLNQRLAGRAGLVVAAMAGLPMVLKGRLPRALDHGG